MGYAPGLVGYSAVKIASPTFYALKDSRTPVTIGMTCILLNVALNLLLVRTSLSYAGLALGTGIAAIANAALLFWMLRRRLLRARRPPRAHRAVQGPRGVERDGGGRLGRRTPAGAALGRPRAVAPGGPRRARHRPRAGHAGAQRPAPPAARIRGRVRARLEPRAAGWRGAVSSPWWKSRAAPRRVRRPAIKARGGRVLGIFDRRATPSAGMHRPSNAVRTSTTGC